MVALALLVDTDQSAEAAALRDGEARGPDAPALIDGEALRTAVVSVVAETLLANSTRLCAASGSTHTTLTAHGGFRQWELP